MALSIYNFNNSSGFALKKGSTEEYKIYLKGQTNCELAIIYDYNKEKHLYTFFNDKEHLRNVIKNYNELLKDFEYIQLNIRKIDTFLKVFINYCLSLNIQVELNYTPF